MCTIINSMAALQTNLCLYSTAMLARSSALLPGILSRHLLTPCSCCPAAVQDLLVMHFQERERQGELGATLGDAEVTRRQAA